MMAGLNGRLIGDWRIEGSGPPINPTVQLQPIRMTDRNDKIYIHATFSSPVYLRRSRISAVVQCGSVQFSSLKFSSF